MINGEPQDSKPVGVKIATKVMVGEQTFHCNPQQLYRALTDKEVLAFVILFFHFLQMAHLLLPISTKVLIILNPHVV